MSKWDDIIIDEHNSPDYEYEIKKCNKTEKEIEEITWQNLKNIQSK